MYLEKMVTECGAWMGHALRRGAIIFGHCRTRQCEELIPRMYRETLYFLYTAPSGLILRLSSYCGPLINWAGHIALNPVRPVASNSLNQFSYLSMTPTMRLLKPPVSLGPIRNDLSTKPGLDHLH